MYPLTLPDYKATKTPFNLTIKIPWKKQNIIHEPHFFMYNVKGH